MHPAVVAKNCEHFRYQQVKLIDFFKQSGKFHSITSIPVKRIVEIDLFCSFVPFSIVSYDDTRFDNLFDSFSDEKTVKSVIVLQNVDLNENKIEFICDRYQ